MDRFSAANTGGQLCKEVSGFRCAHPAAYERQSSSSPASASGSGWLSGGAEAFEALEQLFLAHAVGGDFRVVGIDPGARRADQGNPVGLRLVDLDVFLQRMNELFLEVLGRDRLLRDRATPRPGSCRCRFDGDLGPGGNHARAVAREQNQIEAVFNLVHAIFDGNAGHWLVPARFLAIPRATPGRALSILEGAQAQGRCRRRFPSFDI